MSDVRPGEDPVTDALERLSGGGSAWPDSAELRSRADRRRHRRRVLAGEGATLAAIGLAVGLTLSLHPSTGGRPTHQGGSSGPAAAGVRTESLGGGAVHLVVEVRGARPVTSRATSAAVAGGEADFTGSLLRQLAIEAGSGQNVLTSPLSADVALSMLELGARGATQAAIAGALRQPSALSAEVAAEGWRGLVGELSAKLGPVELNIADSAWLQRGVQFVRSYLAGLAADYGDAAYEADFARDASGATAAINSWVARETDRRITQLFPPRSLGASTILVLANALHFRAKWDASLGRIEPAADILFHSAAGASSKVAAMSTTAAIRIAVSRATTAFELPYAGGRFSALLVEPHGSMSAFLSGLTGARIAQIVGSLRREQASVTLPTLSLSDDTSMNGALSSLGMGVAFSPAADLSGISPQAASVSEVEQANRLVLNEWGTDFASATGVSVIDSATRATGLQVTIDHPYVLLLRDSTTGAIVGAAVVNDPAASAA